MILRWLLRNYSHAKISLYLMSVLSDICLKTALANSYMFSRCIANHVFASKLPNGFFPLINISVYTLNNWKMWTAYFDISNWNGSLKIVLHSFTWSQSCCITDRWGQESFNCVKTVSCGESEWNCLSIMSSDVLWYLLCWALGFTVSYWRLK